MIMQFDTYTFPYNPRKIEVYKSKNAPSFLTLNNSITSQNLGDNPMVIKCYGEFFGNSAERNYNNLKSFLDSGKIGVLSVPYSSPMYARLIKLDIVGEGMGKTISYYAEFLESAR